jgi:beta-lactamase regulating signal transducer with metallopeptidase domain
MIVTSQLLTTFLVNSIWQVPLVAAIAALCSRLMRRTPSAYRHVVWVAALGMCLGLPLVSLWSLVDAPSSLSRTSSQIKADDSGGLGAQTELAHKRFSFLSPKHNRPVSFRPIITWVLVGCYAGFLVFRAARVGWSLRSSLKFRDACDSRNLPAPLFAIAHRYAQAYRLQDIAIRCSPEGALGPVTLSFPQPTLILPERFFTQVSESDFSSALCHELAHVQRHDFLLNLLYELVSLPVSFHPAVVWIKNHIALTRELACDEAAAAKLATPSGYARSLLNISQSLNAGTSKAQPNWALGLFDTNTLEERIMNLLAARNRISRKWAIALGAVASSLLMGTSMGISAFSLQVAQPGKTSGNLQQFVGTWTATHEGTRFLVLELHAEKGKLAGGIKTCSFNMDMQGGTDAIEITNERLTESLPIRNAAISGSSLSFDWKDPDGDEDHLKLEVTGAYTGRVHWVGLPDGLKVAPIPVRKDGAKGKVNEHP